MKTKQTRVSIALSIIVMMMVMTALAGSLTPPGAPAPTMKSLDEIEPRIPIRQSDMPLTISQKGNYYFVEDITFSTPDANAITVETDARGTVIDLNGFTLAGPGYNVGTTGNGIRSLTMIELKNGTIKEFREWGAYCYGVVTGIVAQLNGVGGLRISGRSLIINNVCMNNGGDTTTGNYGILETNGNSIIRENIVSSTINNESGFSQEIIGIKCLSSCNVLNNISYNNAASSPAATLYGIKTGTGCNVIGNVSKGNGYSWSSSAVGLSVDNDSSVSDNVCTNNAGYGIQTGSGCKVQGNEIASNNNDGVLAGAQNSIMNNTCHANGGNGIVVSNNCFVRDNLCSGNLAVSGIRIDGPANVIENNMVSGSSTGILAQVGGSYVASNRATGNSTNYILTGCTVGTGDLTNVGF